MKIFRWDLFLRDYRAFLRKDVRLLKQLSHEWGVVDNVLSRLKTGILNYVGRKTLDKILKGMRLYYDFYCEENKKPEN